MLPVVQRELRAAARAPWNAWGRWLVALGGFLLFGIVAWVGAGSSAQNLSDSLFQILSASLLLYALVAGVLHTTDAISSERREETLGLLFLTDLRGYDIVLGKLTSTSLRSFYAFLGVLPVLALPILMGGVSPGQFWRMTGLLLTTALLSLAVGLMISGFHRDARKATTWALFIGIAAFFLSMAWAWISAWHASQSGAATWPSDLAMWFPGNPLGLWWSIIQESRNPGVGTQLAYSSAIRWLWGLTVGAVLFTSWWVPRSIRWVPGGQKLNQPEEGVEGGGGVDEGERNTGAEDPNAPWAWLKGNDRSIEFRFGSGRVWMVRSPYYWLQRTFRPQSIVFNWTFYSVLTMGAISLLISLFLAKLSDEKALFVAMTIAFGLHQWAKLQIAMAATSGLVEDRRSGALELLIVSGVTSENLIAGQRKALRYQYRWVFRLLILFQLLLVARLAAMCWDYKKISETAILTFVYLFAGCLFLYSDREALMRRGQRQSLVHNDPMKAFRSTWFYTQAPGWLLMVLIGAGWIGTGGLYSSSMGSVTGSSLVWMILCLWWSTRVQRRSDVDLRHGFHDLSTGVPFDSDEWSLRDDFRRAADT